MHWPKITGLVLTLLVAGATPLMSRDAIGAPSAPADAPPVLAAQALRARLWTLFSREIAKPDRRGRPALAGWSNEAVVLAPESVTAADRAPAFPGLPIGGAGSLAARPGHLADAPVLTFVHYNPAAHAHIRRHGLDTGSRLQDWQRRGPADPDFPALRTIPAFPRSARVAMTAWWPVAQGEVNAVPVWDAPTGAGDSGAGAHAGVYLNWPRIVAVRPRATRQAALPLPTLDFAGRTFAMPGVVPASSFVHVAVDRRLARHLNTDPGARKAIHIALARDIRAGDALLLVGLHLLAFEGRKGLWATFWWHDAPSAGRFAQGRPSDLPRPWRHYLMDATNNAVEPREPDGSPAICFNPWFDAVFPDGGQGGGRQSNCVNCHTRAGYPPVDFLPVRRGAPDGAGDPAFAPGRLRTGLLWGLANPGMTPVTSTGGTPPGGSAPGAAAPSTPEH